MLSGPRDADMMRPEMSADPFLEMPRAEAMFGCRLSAASAMPDRELALAQANHMLQFIRFARQSFPMLRDLADHPGWEIMLHVFVANREARVITTADLSDLINCWRPLAVRYVELLIERGLVDRDMAALNVEGAPLRLTEDAEGRFQTLLCEVARGWALAPGAALGRA